MLDVSDRGSGQTDLLGERILAQAKAVSGSLDAFSNLLIEDVGRVIVARSAHSSITMTGGGVKNVSDIHNVSTINDL